MESAFLSASTQKLRKSLLIASLVGYAISKAGLKVEKVSLLGSELVITRFEVIPFVLGIVVLFFLATFMIFGIYDYALTYAKRARDILESISKGTITSLSEAKRRIEELEGKLRTLRQEMASAFITSPEREGKIRDRIREIEKENEIVKRMVEFETHYGTSIFERIAFRVRMRMLRTLFDLYIPILVGIYVVILLFFFTKIPVANKTTPKPGPEVTTIEKVDADNTAKVE